MTAKRNALTKRRKRFLRTRRLLRRPRRIPAQFRHRTHRGKARDQRRVTAADRRPLGRRPHPHRGLT
jgi:hypothetical protein